MGRSSVHLSDSKRSWNNCCIAEWRRVALIPVWYTPNVIPQRLLFPRNTNARTDAIKYWVWIKNHLADGTTEEENAVFLELEAIASKRQSVLSYRLVLALHKLQYDRCWAQFRAHKNCLVPLVRYSVSISAHRNIARIHSVNRYAWICRGAAVGPFHVFETPASALILLKFKAAPHTEWVKRERQSTFASNLPTWCHFTFCHSWTMAKLSIPIGGSCAI